MLSTILVVATFIILTSYQEYETNIMRSSRNWEAEFKNIKYSDALEIAKDENVKEISIIQRLGICEENFFGDSQTSGASLRILVSAYDENAIKNCHVVLTEGRLPEREGEIVIHDGDISAHSSVGDVVELTLNGEKREYTVVGLTSTELPGKEGGFSFQFINPAITYYDESKMTDDTIVDVSILTKNINKIFETTKNLATNLKLYETEEEQNENLVYYKKLLNYSLVKMENNQEENRIFQVR